ncbi:hypothetical protein HP570_20380 [Brevibacillus sp. RS1.1]|uniref:hypothetical protein n=1 Tax=Brevibacillus sp. RS1.1 TaxID=2738982 RepID=UPI00156B725F|nr:hypothetical protein [Brevibacillus sp. RS1.1]NRR04575.1 hypothetical protein [Brevibacillus sp. RS1.1]
MKFSIKGTIRSIEYVLTFQDGEITGSPLALTILQYKACLAEAEGEAIGPIGGPYAKPPYLKDPVAAYILMTRVFTSIISYTGDKPPGRHSLPDGAIG